MLVNGTAPDPLATLPHGPSAGAERTARTVTGRSSKTSPCHAETGGPRGKFGAEGGTVAAHSPIAPASRVGTNLSSAP
jgi:hypothetical protein